MNRLCDANASSQLMVRGLLLGFAVVIALAPYLFLATPAAIFAWGFTMIASAVAMAALAIGSVWQRPGLIAAVFLAGFSGQLGLTWHPFLPFAQFYPSFFFPDVPLGVMVFYLALAVLQAIVTAWLLLVGKALPGIVRFVLSIGLVRTLAFAVLMFCVSATVFRLLANPQAVVFLGQFGAANAFILLNLGTVVVLVRSLPRDDLAALAEKITGAVSLPGAADVVRPLDRHLPVVVAIVVVIACAIVSVLAFQRLPHVPDEVAYIFQAKYFALGQISVPVPAILEAFRSNFLDVYDGRWFSIFPPGWPLILALGVPFGLGWLINPFLAGATILLTHKLLQRVSTTGTANVAILLMATSPWLIAMSASFMSHTLTLFLLVASWLLLSGSRDDGSIPTAFAAGAIMGFLFLVRPLDGLVAGILTGLWCLTALRERTGWRIVLGYGLGCIAVGALVFPYNYFLIGDPLAHPINRYFDRVWHPGANSFGFGKDIGPPGQWGGIDLYPGHSPKEAVINTQNYAYHLNLELFGWGIGSLAFVFLHAVWGKWSRIDHYMAAFCVVVMLVFSLYWFSATFYIGPRYLYLLVFPLTVLTVSGINTLGLRLRTMYPEAALPVPRFATAVIVLCALSLVSFMTFRSVNKYYEVRAFHADYRTLIAQHNLDGALVFVRQEGNFWDARADRDFGSALIFNSPDFKGSGPIFARDLGAANNRAVAARFPGRPIYFVLGRSRAVDKVRVIQGPIAAKDLP